ncbi:MAG: DUF167 domain-containing protein [Puniceicoccales bacterium]|jgi:uncharacterized protein (TIGR00251 family)|nr:DUF167 domain-containing protein [Puniceicoccales bacterium]
MVTISVHIIANSSRSYVVGKEDDSIKIKIQEPPHSSRANAALIKFLASKLSLSKGSIKIISGERSRKKILSIGGPFTIDQIFAKLLIEEE